MKVALIIATIHRKAELECLLASLLGQTYREFMVILADQNPVGFLVPLLAKFKKKLNIKHLYVPANGVSNARNAGIEAMPDDAQLIAFPDDDCFYEPDTLEQAVNYLRTYSECSGILGQWQVPGASYFAFSPQKINRYSAFRRGETYTFFFRLTPAVKALHYDPLIGPGTGLPWGCGEDTDYLLRFMEVAEYAVFRVADVHVRHPASNVDCAYEKIYAYAAGRMYLLRKHDYPLWFQIFTVVYPLLRMPLDGRKKFKYRWNMFWGRLVSFWQKNRNN